MDELEETLRDREGQGSLVCGGSGLTESDTTQQLNNNRGTKWTKEMYHLC